MKMSMIAHCTFFNKRSYEKFCSHPFYISKARFKNCFAIFVEGNFSVVMKFNHFLAETNVHWD